MSALVLALVLAWPNMDTWVMPEPRPLYTIVPLLEGAQAPFMGLLVPEARYDEFIQAEIDVYELTARLKAAERVSALLEGVYLTKLKEAATTHWYDSPSLNRWLGISLGAFVVVSVYKTK